MLALTACKTPERTKTYNTPDSKEIYIGVAYQAGTEDKSTYFYKGVALAVEIVNQNGGVLNKTLKTVVRDDGDDATTAVKIAQTFSSSGITAVIGHWSTGVSAIAGDVYESNKVVMITPAATGAQIFDYDDKYIFRMMYNDQEYAAAIADYIAQNGFKNMAVYYGDDAYGRGFANMLEQELDKRGVTVADRIVSISKTNLKTIMNRWNAFGCEGVIFADIMPRVGEAIKLIRDANPGYAYFGSDDLELINLKDILGKYAAGIYVATYKKEDLDKSFLDSFQAKYGHEPDIYAITGYETVMLLKDAFTATGSIDGAKTAEYLAALRDYQTISSKISYNPTTKEFDGRKLEVRVMYSN